MDTLTTPRPRPERTEQQQQQPPPTWRIRAMLEAMAWARAAGLPFSRYRAVKAI